MEKRHSCRFSSGKKEMTSREYAIGKCMHRCPEISNWRLLFLGNGVYKLSLNFTVCSYIDSCRNIRAFFYIVSSEVCAPVDPYSALLVSKYIEIFAPLVGTRDVGACS